MDILEKLKFAQQVHLDASQEIEKMCDRMVDIACSSDFNDLDTSCLGLPEWGERMDSWWIDDTHVHTRWIYTDPYDDTGDRTTYWNSPLDWWTMSDSSLKARLLEICEENKRVEDKLALRDLERRAEQLGYKLV